MHPQALADERSRSILFVWDDMEEFVKNWASKVKTVDAPGIKTHPRLVKVGDVIDLFITGWNKSTVEEILFTPHPSDIPDYHRCGTYSFKTEQGFINLRVDGRHVIDVPVFVFPSK